MLRRLFAAAVLMSAALMLAGAHDPADARHGGGHGHGRGGGHGHVRVGGHHFAGHRVRHARFAVRRRHVRLRRMHHRRLLAARHYYYGRRHCRWLHYRALVTGSRYWWWRYWRCVHGHPYY